MLSPVLSPRREGLRHHRPTGKPTSGGLRGCRVPMGFVNPRPARVYAIFERKVRWGSANGQTPKKDCVHTCGKGDKDLLDNVNDFSAGLGDALLLGAGGYLRDQLGIQGVDSSSGWYEAGSWATAALGFGRMAYAGVAKAGSILAASGTNASMFRHGLKSAFRLGMAESWRAPNLAKYPTDAALRAAAGRTNAAVNAYGAGVAAAGTAGATGGCPCSH